MRYTEADFERVNAIDHILSRPEMYVPKGEVSAEHLVGRIVADILVSQDRVATALRHGDWRVVASAWDWIGEKDPARLMDYFKNIVPFPEAGQNAMHAEVLLTAFCKDVITSDGSTTSIIKGESDERVTALLNQHRGWSRAIAFRL